jgi:hypothetical protein
MNVPMAGKVAAGVVAVLLLAGCEKAATVESDGGGPAVVEEPAAGTEVARVTLTEDAAARIDVQTMQVRARSGHKGGELQIPYAAVLYDPDGQTWTYTNPEPLVFLRAPIDVVRIDRSRAVLSKGPPPGTKVVTVGAAELLGAEYEVGEE